jgi:hypothetical protein
MSQFDIDKDVLRTQGGAFINIGTTFGAASKRMQDSLEALGAPWAEDDLGELFGTIYEPLRDGIFSSMDALGEQLQEIGHKLQGMATRYNESDLQNAQALGKTYG